MAKKGFKGLSNLLQVYLIEEIKPVVAERFQEKYNEIIDDFYNDYMPTSRGPKRYHRTGSLYDMTSVAYGFQEVPGAGKNKIRINVDASYLGSNPYWSVLGRRSINPYTGEDSISGNVVYRTFLADRVLYNSYVKGAHGNVQKFPWVQPKDYIKPMSSPPQKEMNDWWHNFVQGNEFRDIVKDAMPRALARVKAKFDH